MWKIHDTPHSGIANPLNTNAITFPEHWVDEANPNTAPRFLGGVMDESTFCRTGCIPPAAA